MEEHQAAHLTYRSQQATEPATRDVYPLSWSWKSGSSYLMAVSPEHDSSDIQGGSDRGGGGQLLRLPAVPRLRPEPPTSRIARDLRRRRRYQVVVKFLPEAGPPRRGVPMAQEQGLDPAAGRQPHLRLQLSNTVEIKSRILAYGPPPSCSSRKPCAPRSHRNWGACSIPIGVPVEETSATRSSS